MGPLAGAGDTFAQAVTDGPLLLAVVVAVLAGLVSFLSPCVLPLVPGYLSYVTGLTGAELGETAPARVGPGEPIQAGAINLTGRLVLRVVARSEDSAVAAIARLMEAGAQSRSRYVRLADRAAPA